MKRIKIQKADFYNGLYVKKIETPLKKYYEIEYSDQPDFLFYSVYGSGIDHYRFDNCVKIFWGCEGVIPDFNECDYAFGSYPMNIGERYLEIPYEAIPRTIQNREEYRHMDISNRKFCNFLYSNASLGNGALLRQEFCKELMKYKRVDCPGKVLNNMTDAIEPREGNWHAGKMDFIGQYKFTIAFENCGMPGMITEKLIDAFRVGSVPIYWGDEKVAMRFNTKAFINCHDYSSWEEVIERVKELDQDDRKYREMLCEKPMLPEYDVNYDERIEAFLCDIVERGNAPFEKNSLSRDAGTNAARQLIEMDKTPYYAMYSLQNKIMSGSKKVWNKMKKK